jgi:hypothetical protein
MPTKAKKSTKRATKKAAPVTEELDLDAEVGELNDEDLDDADEVGDLDELALSDEDKAELGAGTIREGSAIDLPEGEATAFAELLAGPNMLNVDPDAHIPEIP